MHAVLIAVCVLSRNPAQELTFEQVLFALHHYYEGFENLSHMLEDLELLDMMNTFYLDTATNLSMFKWTEPDFEHHTLN